LLYLKRYSKMERGSINRDTTVRNSYGGITAAAILLGIIVIVILVIILIRRPVSSTEDRVEGSGASECVITLDCTNGQVCDTNAGLCVDCVTDGDCPSTTGICDTSDNTCKECVTDSNCPFSKPNCNLANSTCYQCFDDTECSGIRGICDIPNETCVQCFNDSHCGGSTPFCSDTNNFSCVECLVDGDCASGSCLANGVCCDLTAPTANSLFISDDTPNILFTVVYSFTQPSAISSLIVELSDANNTVIWVSAGVAATGSHTHGFSPNSYPRLFYGFLYNVRVRISTSCGVTPWSNYVSALQQPALTNIVTVGNIISGTADGSGGNARVSGIDAIGCGISFPPEILISSTPTLDPNFSIQAINEFSASCCAPGDCNVSWQWPFPVTDGQQFFIRVTTNTTLSGGTGNVSNALSVVVDIP
jgi:hypothetical protein